MSIIRRPLILGGAGRTFFHCWTEAVPEATVLRVEGEVDVATAPMLASAIAAAFGQSERVIVDLSSLQYLDGSGIHVLEDASYAKNGGLVVVGSRPEIQRLFDILALTTVLAVVATVEAARAHFREP